MRITAVYKVYFHGNDTLNTDLLKIYILTMAEHTNIH